MIVELRVVKVMVVILKTQNTEYRTNSFFAICRFWLISLVSQKMIVAISNSYQITSNSDEKHRSLIKSLMLGFGWSVSLIKKKKH